MKEVSFKLTHAALLVTCYLLLLKQNCYFKEVFEFLCILNYSKGAAIWLRTTISYAGIYKKMFLFPVE